VRQHRDAIVADLDRRIASLEAEIAVVLEASAWAESLACLTSAPGIGLVTAAWLLVGTRNFALCASPTALAAYVGLAPMPRESGRSVRGRPTIGHDGNRRLRTALYMATLSAARYNPAIKAFYDRLQAGGKPHKVARCAAARKLLHQAWALGTKQQRFAPNHGQHRQEGAPELAACGRRRATSRCLGGGSPTLSTPGSACGIAIPQAELGRRRCFGTGDAHYSSRVYSSSRIRRGTRATLGASSVFAEARELGIPCTWYPGLRIASTGTARRTSPGNRD